MRWTRAPAKVNLTLRVLGLRPDGYHEVESLVAFAGISDWLGFEPGADLGMEVEGTHAGDAGPVDDNLVLRAARSLSARVPGLTLGRFRLAKRLPTAAGLGGGSADAAAALRILAQVNGLAVTDERIQKAAAATGADAPVCLESRAREMTGVGDRLGSLLRLPPLFVVLANPRVPAPTSTVFKAYDAEPKAPGTSGPGFDPEATVSCEAIAASSNDLEGAARTIAPVIGDVIEALSQLPGARLARMSGSGATCFALFDDPEPAAAGALKILAEHPEWWVTATAVR